MRHTKWTWIAAATVVVACTAIGASLYVHRCAQEARLVRAVSCLRQIPPGAFATLAPNNDAAWSALASGGKVVLMRHGRTPPGQGDPPEFRIDDRSTQLNLSDEGRQDAVNVGQQFRNHRVTVAHALCSQWFRCQDTAQLAFGTFECNATLNAMATDPAERNAQLAAMRQLASSIPSDGANVAMVTHQTDILALTGIDINPGECLVLRPDGAGLVVAARLDATR